MTDEMINVLKEEQASDDAQKAFCDKVFLASCFQTMSQISLASSIIVIYTYVPLCLFCLHPANDVFM